MAASPRFFETVWRRRNLVAGLVILVVLFGLSTSALLPPRYAAEAYLTAAQDRATFLAAIKKTNTETLLKSAIAGLSLLEDPEYNPGLDDPSTIVAGWQQDIRRSLFDLSQNQDAESYALMRLAENVTLTFAAGTGMAIIRVRSRSAQGSAEIANFLQDAYRKELQSAYAFVETAEGLSSQEKPGVLVEKAEPNWKTSPPDMAPFFAISLVAGFVIAIFCALQADALYLRRKNR